MKSRWRSERGQAAVEWGGVLLLVAVMIAVVLAAMQVLGVTASIAKGLECNVAKVFGADGGCPAPGSPAAGPRASDPNAPWSSSDPVTRATWGQYVSLGDSYSAGEGLGNYQPGSHVGQSRCRVGLPFGGPCIYHQDPKVIDGCDRSGSAYNSTVSGHYGFKGGKQTWACSGATTQDIYDPSDPHGCHNGAASGRYGEGCQVNRLNSNTSLVTMSIGGNDAGFANDLTSCYENRLKLHWSKPCSFEAQSINQKIAGIGPNLIADLRAMRARAPHARIILMTYPRLFPEPPSANSACIGPNICLTPSDQEFFNQEAARLDAAICAAAAQAGVGAECVNASDAFAGCEMGQANSCVQAPSLHISGSTVVGVNPGAFHPTQRGQEILGQLIDHEIQNPPPGTGGP